MKRVWMGLLALIVASPLLAWGPDLSPGRWWENPQLVERLELTVEQRELIRDRVFEHARAMIDLDADVKRSELQLQQLGEEQELRINELRAAFAVFQTARHRLEAERFEMLLSVAQLLTPAQREKLKQLREHRRRSEDRPQHPSFGRSGENEQGPRR
jgi:Spy/CpxP family protein refolding chaperone